MQLVAYGAQDVYLTGNPQITFFKVVYRRHTNFSMEAIEQTFNGTAAIGNQVTATISRNGDLIHRMYIQTDITSTLGSDETNVMEIVNAGHAILKEVTVEIGGQRIDKHYSRWLDIWNELTLPQSKVTGVDEMINATLASKNIDLSNAAAADPHPKVQSAKTVYVPLQFWFCRNPGLALPLIALQYHEVKVNVTFENEATLNTMGSATEFFDNADVAASAADPNTATKADPTLSIANTSLWVDYIYLDTDERRRFAQVSHEYLIEQLQHTGSVASSEGSHRLNFNHPVKELIWVEKQNATKPNVQNPVNNGWLKCLQSQSAKLLLNGHDRFSERKGSYFTLVQPYQHHTAIPSTSSSAASANIHVYSFALKPEDHQPSGTCNMSRIDNANLHITKNTNSETTWIYAVNYNVLRIMGGMGGLAYSN